jgi:hypothetical protein
MMNVLNIRRASNASRTVAVCDAMGNVRCVTKANNG